MVKPTHHTLFVAPLPSPHAKWDMKTHYAAAHRVSMWWFAIEFYIKEMHAKKSVKGRKKYKLRCKADD
eukprot:2346467-Prymnesium_polylepis.1